MDKTYRGFVPEKTKKATKLAVKVFKQCQVHRNEMTLNDGKQRPSNLLERPKSMSSTTGSHGLL